MEATVALHESRGPLATSLSAIARRAGVERLTVRAHFPALPDLFKACSGLFFTRNPPPDPEGWSRIGDHRERLREALAQVYEFYGRNERMLGNVTRDARLAPDLVGVGYGTLLMRMRGVLSAGWETDRDAEPVRQGAIGHALDFTTWRSLVRDQGLRNDQAVELMLQLAADASVAVAGRLADRGQVGQSQETP